MRRYFQVNQAYANQHEFNKAYLCAPDQEGVAHYWILRSLRDGDIIFHYSSHAQAIFGLSKVIELGPHKGLENALIVETAPFFRVYEGQHLSLRQMSMADQKDELSRVDQRYIEVHTSIVERKNLGRNFFPNQQLYCRQIPTADAEKRLGINQKSAAASQAPLVKRRPVKS